MALIDVFRFEEEERLVLMSYTKFDLKNVAFYSYQKSLQKFSKVFLSIKTLIINSFKVFLIHSIETLFKSKSHFQLKDYKTFCISYKL